MERPRKPIYRDFGKSITIITLLVLGLLLGMGFLNTFYFTDSWIYQVSPYNGERSLISIQITQEELSEYPNFARTLKEADENGLVYINNSNASNGALTEYFIWLESVDEWHYPLKLETDSGDYLVTHRVIGGYLSDDWWLAYISLICLLAIPVLLFKWSRQT